MKPATVRALPARGRKRRFEIVALVAASAFAVSTARAQDPASGASEPAQEAKQQYVAGEEAYAAKRFAEAALHFEAAAEHRPHAAALYNAALAWEQSSRPERAADDFGRALGVSGLSPGQMQNARARVATLEQTMGTLDVAAPEGWRVGLDANTDVPAPARLHAAPGVHQLTIVAPNAPIRRRDVALELGKTVPLALAPEPVASTPAASVPAASPGAAPAEGHPRAPREEWWNLRRGLGVGAVGLGVAFLASGVVLGASALDARTAYNAAPSQAGYDHANALAGWTDATVVAGAVFALGGAALVLWPTTQSAAPSERAADSGARVAIVPTLGGALVRGAF